MNELDQKTSWFAGQDEGVIAQIFFPTDGDKLGSWDREVLNQVETFVRSNLAVDERVELLIVGHADHRHTEKHNKALGQSRASAVAGQLSQGLRHETGYNHHTGISRGEELATQDTDDPEILAHDRRVDIKIFGSERLEELPQLPEIKEVENLSSVHYDLHTLSGRDVPTGGAPDWFKPLLDLVIKWISSRNDPDTGGHTVYGDLENMRYEWMDHRWAVNKISIRGRREWTQFSGGAEHEYGYTTVRYTWGEPKSKVEVEIDNKNTVDGRVHRIQKTVFVDRKIAQKSNFYNPPPRIKEFR